VTQSLELATNGANRRRRAAGQFSDRASPREFPILEEKHGEARDWPINPDGLVSARSIGMLIAAAWQSARRKKRPADTSGWKSACDRY
jgi:hypothetical protein